MSWLRSTLVLLVLFASACSSERPPPLEVGAVYPLSGSQGPGGIEEYRGLQVAAQLVNDSGGVHGRPIRLQAVDVPGAEAAPAPLTISLRAACT